MFLSSTFTIGNIIRADKNITQFIINKIKRNINNKRTCYIYIYCSIYTVEKNLMLLEHIFMYVYCI